MMSSSTGSLSGRLPIIPDKADMIRKSTVRRRISRRLRPSQNKSQIIPDNTLTKAAKKTLFTPRSTGALPAPTSSDKTPEAATSADATGDTFPRLQLFKAAAVEIGKQALLSRKKSDIADVWLQDAAKNGVDSDTFYTMYKTARNGSYGGLWRRRNRSPSATNSPKSRTSKARTVPPKTQKRKKSPRSAYIEKLDELKLAPELKPIAKQFDKVDLLGYSLGDDRMVAVAESLKLRDFSSLNIGSNRLGVDGAIAAIEAISPSCSELDISCNKMGTLGCRYLADDVIASPQHELITLNLASNDIGDAGLRHLCNGFKNNTSLKRLNLNSNKITELGGNMLATAFTNTKHLEELCIAWNNVDLAAAVILERIKSLQHLDISSNSLGIQSVKDFDDSFNHSSMANDGHGGSVTLALRIAEALAKNNQLRHLDIRDNSFSEDSIRHIAAGLNDNHTLLGIHIAHPVMQLDAKQFLQILPKQKDIRRVDTARNSRHCQQRNTVVDTETGTSQWLRLPNTLERKGKFHNCWICEGWTEVELSVVLRYKDGPERHKAAAKNGVRIHLSVDAFHGELMYKSKDYANPDFMNDKATAKSAMPGKLKKQSGKHARAGKRAREQHGQTLVSGIPLDRASLSDGEDLVDEPPPPTRAFSSRDEPADLHFTLHRCLPPGSKIYFYFSTFSERTITKEVAVANKGKKKGKGKKGGGGGGVTMRLVEETIVSFDLFTSNSYRRQPWSQWSHKAYELMTNIRQAAKSAVHDLVPCEVNNLQQKRRSGPLRITKALPRVFNAGGDQKATLSRFCWSLKSSIFAPRAAESDSHAFFSTESFVKRMVHADWRYSKLGGDDGTLQYKFQHEDDPEALEMVVKASADQTMTGFNLLFKRATSLHCGIFCDPFTLKRNAYTTILHECKLFEAVKMNYKDGFVMSLPMAKKEIDLIFITTNLESDSNKDADEGDVSLKIVNDDNPDNALNRFEWLEALVNIALKRFNTVTRESDVKADLTVAGKEYKRVYVGDALPLLLSSFMKELGDPHTPDDFRRYFLYKENVDLVFHTLQPELQRLFNVACGRMHNHNHGYMTFKQWMSLLSDHTNDLVPDIISLEVLRRVYINSKMDFLQCIKSERIQGLHFVDFLEALARLALIVLKPKGINRNFSICIARFFFLHFAQTQLEHGRRAKVCNLAKNYLKKKDSVEESGYVNDFEEEHRQAAITQVMSHLRRGKPKEDK